jgi:hypothetical protein
MSEYLSKRNDLIFITVLVLAVCLVGLILVNNIYDSLYPPLFSGPVIDVAQVLERIDDAGLTPTEAKYYRVIEKDRQGNVKEVSRPDATLMDKDG